MVTPFLIKENGVAKRIQVVLENEIKSRKYRIKDEWQHIEFLVVKHVINAERSLLGKKSLSVTEIWPIFKNSYGILGFSYTISKKGEKLVLEKD